MPILDTPTLVKAMDSKGNKDTHSTDHSGSSDSDQNNSVDDNLVTAINNMELDNAIKIKNKMKQFPHTGLPYVNARHVLTVPNLRGPIGVALLPYGRIAVSSTKDNKVAIIDCYTGKILSEIKDGLRRPSDLCALPDGRLCIRDRSGVVVFDSDTGKELQRMDFVSNAGGRQKSFGLAQDGAGHLATICLKGSDAVVVLIHEVDTAEQVGSIDITEVITDLGKSMCRFLFMTRKFLYIGDLGLNKIYMVNLKTGGVSKFGQRGSGMGQFVDPAGIAMDPDGAILVADAGNHRMLLFDPNRKFVCKVMTDKPLKRPSGLVYDPEEGSIYVLNLRGDSLLKFILD